MSEKVHDITDAPKAPLTTRQKLKLAAGVTLVVATVAALVSSKVVKDAAESETDTSEA